jgi:hypothetical protein
VLFEGITKNEIDVLKLARKHKMGVKRARKNLESRMVRDSFQINPTMHRR